MTMTYAEWREIDAELAAENARLRARIAELEGDLKTVADVLQEFDGDTIWQQAQAAVVRIAELEAVDKKPEPVAWRALVDGVWFTASTMRALVNALNQSAVISKTEPLYAAPPAREWVELTDEEVDKLFIQCRTVRQAVRWIEAALKAKNT